MRVRRKALYTLATIVAEFGDYSRQCGQGLRCGFRSRFFFSLQMLIKIHERKPYTHYLSWKIMKTVHNLQLNHFWFFWFFSTLVNPSTVIMEIMTKHRWPLGGTHFLYTMYRKFANQSGELLIHTILIFKTTKITQPRRRDKTEDQSAFSTASQSAVRWMAGLVSSVLHQATCFNLLTRYNGR